jgi:hypothetical protein
LNSQNSYQAVVTHWLTQDSGKIPFVFSYAQGVQRVIRGPHADRVRISNPILDNSNDTRTSQPAKPNNLPVDIVVLAVSHRRHLINMHYWFLEKSMFLTANSLTFHHSCKGRETINAASTYTD